MKVLFCQPHSERVYLLHLDDLFRPRQDGLWLREHGVVSLVEDAGVHEAATVAPRALTLRVEAAHRLRFEPLLPRVAPFVVGKLALLELLLLFPFSRPFSLSCLVPDSARLRKFNKFEDVFASCACA